jgi:hypothetical protein
LIQEISEKDEKFSFEKSIWNLHESFVSSFYTLIALETSLESGFQIFNPKQQLNHETPSVRSSSLVDCGHQ